MKYISALENKIRFIPVENYVLIARGICEEGNIAFFRNFVRGKQFTDEHYYECVRAVVRYNQVTFFHKLITHCENLGILLENKKLPILRYAIEHSSLLTVQAIVERWDLRLDQDLQAGEKPIHTAAIFDRLDLVNYFLEKGVDVNQINNIMLYWLQSGKIV